MNIVGYYDIETEDWDTFVCGGILTEDDYAEYTWGNEREYVLHLLRLEGTILAHNGGKFDHLWFLDALDRFGFLSSLSVSLTMSGASIVRAQLRGDNVDLTLADSYKMFMPLSLRDLSEGKKLDVNFLKCSGQGQCAELMEYQRRYHPDDVNGCGGYCRISRRMSKRDLRRLMDYMEMDCRALKDGVEYMLSFAETQEIKTGWTVGSTAWKTATALIPELPTQELSTMEYEYARNGFFGGRVSLFRRYADRGYQYDITSSYPNQCSNVLPRPETRDFICDTKRARRAYIRDTEGIYSADVVIPDMFIPPLPYRANINGDNRLAFPTGKIHGTWAFPELKYAESLGCKIEPETALVFRKSENYLGDFMHRLIELRMKCGKKSREGRWLKWIANSLYGKFASRPDVENVYLNPNEDMLLGSENSIRRIGTRFGIYINPTYRILDCAHIVWASYITARARVQLHKMLNKHGGTDAIYCDTDSCFAMRKRTIDDGLGNGLGLWSNEGDFTEFQGIAPKVYRYVREGKSVMRAKGVVLPHDIDKAWNLICDHKVVNGKPRIRGFRSAINIIARKGEGKLFEKEMPHRLVSEGFGDRIDLGNGISRPPHVSELNVATEVDNDDS